MFVRRISAALLLASTALLATAAPALAHTELKSSDPAKGASLPSAPRQITLTFSEAVQSIGVEVKVAGPGGAQWNVQQASVAGAVVTAPVVPTGPAGEYTVTWRVFADDGDAITGKFAFTLTGPAAAPVTTQPALPPPVTTAPAGTVGSQPDTRLATQGTTSGVNPSAQQQSTSSSGIGVWIWILIAVVVIAAVVIVVLRARKPKTPAE
jgi:methionine-rich copper-binding protein CopC